MEELIGKRVSVFYSNHRGEEEHTYDGTVSKMENNLVLLTDVRDTDVRDEVPTELRDQVLNTSASAFLHMSIHDD